MNIETRGVLFMEIPKEILEIMRNVKNVAVLTGAGISAESGIITFRGKDGIWDKFNPDEVATPEAFERDPLKVWDFHNDLRQEIAANKPNPAHYALAEMEKHFENFVLITQNIDQYHQDAGSKNVIELHGNAWRVRCLKESTISSNYDVPIKKLPPYCSCGSMLRPDVVWFNEQLSPDNLERAFTAANECQLMLVIGTSAYVQPAASLPHNAYQNGAVILEFNLEPTAHSGIATYSFFGKAGDTLPELWKCLKKL
jgi:NAD-dependent deacetylase